MKQCIGSPQDDRMNGASHHWVLRLTRQALGVCALSVALMGLMSSVGFAAQPDRPQATQAQAGEAWVPGHILVMPRAGVPEHALARLFKAHNGHARKMGQSNLYLVKVPAATEQAVVAQLKNNPHLKFAELDRVVKPNLIPNDAYYFLGWHLPKINMPAAWDYSMGENVTIAIIDTGVDVAHPDVGPNVIGGWNFFDNNNVLDDRIWPHGTHVAGVAAGITNNAQGTAGVAGHAQILALRISDHSGLGQYSTIAEALIYAADQGAQVANISFGGINDSSAVRSAAQYMRNKGGVVVNGAGNSGKDEFFFATPSLITVSATDQNDQRATFSSGGSYVDVSAPGVGIWGPDAGGGYTGLNGTSFSSPIVAGVMALMMSVNPTLSPDELEQVLISTVTDIGNAGYDASFGYGRVNAAAAVSTALVTQHQTDTQAPTASITSPTQYTTVSGIVPVDINVTDNVGVVRVDLYANGTLVAVDDVAPFQLSWDSVGMADGLTSLVLNAYDAAGNKGSSNAVWVNVANSQTPPPVTDTTPPTVSIVNPVAGTVSGAVTITVNATDNANVADLSLSLYIDDVLFASGTGSTLSATWNTKSKSVTLGTHVIKARAEDKGGNNATTFVTVEVVKSGGSTGGGGGGKGKNR